MKRQIFLLAVEKFRPDIISMLQNTETQRPLVMDAFQDAIVNILEKKSYAKFDTDAVDGRMFTYLKQATIWQICGNLRKVKRENTTVTRLPDENLLRDDSLPTVNFFIEDKPIPLEETECPFCFGGLLNKYGACGLCHTILGAGVNTLRDKLSIVEVAFTYNTDYEMSAAVKRATEKLTTFEQKMVRHVVQGNDSLEDFAVLSESSRMTMWRKWVVLKNKLKIELGEYSPFLTS